MIIFTQGKSKSGKCAEKTGIFSLCPARAAKIYKNICINFEMLLTLSLWSGKVGLLAVGKVFHCGVFINSCQNDMGNKIGKGSF